MPPGAAQGKDSSWPGTLPGIAALIALPFLLLAWLLTSTALEHAARHQQAGHVLAGFEAGFALLAPLETMRDLAPAAAYLAAPDTQARYAAAHEEAAQRLGSFLAQVRRLDNESLTAGAARIEESWKELTIDANDVSNAAVPFENIERFNGEIYAALSGMLTVSDLAAGERVGADEMLMLALDTTRKARRELGMVRAIAVYTALRDGYLSSTDAGYLDNAWSSLDALRDTLAGQLDSIHSRGEHAGHIPAARLDQVDAYLQQTEDNLILAPQITLDWQQAWNNGEAGLDELRAAAASLLADATDLVAAERRRELRLDVAAAVGLLLMYGVLTALGVAFYRTRYAAVHAQAESRAKSLFLARMSHEIRTPLNGVIGLAELLADTGPTPRQREYIELIGSAGRSLVSLVNDILDHAKIEAGKLELERSPVDIRALLAESAQVFGLRAGENRTLIFCTTDSDVPAVMTGDPTRIRQVLLNLIGNAVKFTEQGRIEVHAGIATGADGADRLRIEVRDTGIGLTPAEQQNLFNLFTQASADVARKFGGTGLGLSISRELVRLMGGSIGVYSGVGAGSVFWFELPLQARRAEPATPAPAALPAPVLLLDVDGHLARAVSALPDAVTHHLSIAVSELDAQRVLAMHPDLRFVVINGQRRTDDALLMARHLVDHHPGLTVRLLLAVGSTPPEGVGEVVRDVAARSVFTPTQLVNLLSAPEQTALDAASAPTEPVRTVLPTGLRVLVAEDNPVNQLVTRGLLAKLGIEAEIVADGRQAVERYRERGGDYDIVLMDLDMPVLDGNAATREMRALEAARGWRRCPILALSAHALPEYGELARAAGMDGQVVKPVTLAMLGEALRTWYRRR